MELISTQSRSINIIERHAFKHTVHCKGFITLFVGYEC